MHIYKKRGVLEMGKGKFVEKITAMEDDFAQWYTDVVSEAELIDYGPVRGTMIMRPYGFSLWESVKEELDSKIKDTGQMIIIFQLFILVILIIKLDSINVGI